MKNKYEVAQLGAVSLPVDVSQIGMGDIFFNATEVAKSFGKSPKDWLRNQDTVDYMKALSQEENYPFENYTRVTQGGKYKGTWLHSSLRIPFARWCSPLFAVRLDKWVIKRLEEEKVLASLRLAAKTGYLALSEAIEQAHDEPKFYHYSNEANMINQIVLGMTAKQFKAKKKVAHIREGLSEFELKELEKLQRINASLIELGMAYDIRKEMLYEKFHNIKRLAA